MTIHKFIMLVKENDVYSIKYFQGQSQKDIYSIPGRTYDIEAIFRYNEENATRCKYMKESLNRITKQSKS